MSEYQALPQFKLNEVITDNPSFDTCKVTDMFYSITSNRWCYEVFIENGNFLATEEQLTEKL